MFKVALARKQRGGYGQHNLRQYPIVFLSEGPEPDDSYEHDAPEVPAVCQSHVNLPAKVPPFPYEKFRCELNFDITWLSILITSFGRKAARLLASKPARLKGMLIPNQWSYLNFIPTRYESGSLLQDVFFCIAAQSCLLLQPQPTCNEAAILRVYGCALQRLQKVLADPNGYLDPDVLCVVEVLAFFELVKFSRGDRWQFHVIGASQIVSNIQVQILSTNLHA